MAKFAISKSLNILFATALFCFGAGMTNAKGFVETDITHVAYPDWFHDSSFLDLSEEISTSASTGKKGLMLLFTTEGCSYCTAFIEQSLRDKEIVSSVKANFISIGMEIFNDTEMVDTKGIDIPIKAFAKREGVQFSPTLLFFDNTGKRVLRLAGYKTPAQFKPILAYLTGDHYQKQSLRDYLKVTNNNSAITTTTKLQSDPLFEKPPYALDRSHFAAEKPLIVLFEETACSECNDFHTQVLASKKVRETLQHFDVVRLDANDKKTPVLTPDGKRTTPSEWFAANQFAQLPALLFFDEKGQEILQTDALVMENRMMNSMGLVLEKAYQKGWTYQRFARSKSMERMRKKQSQETAN